MTTALILAGHGSHISPDTGGLVWQMVDRLREMGVADEITAAFWKEKPSFARVLDTVLAHEVTVVPLFTAQGYFTQTVIPTEMGLAGRLTRRGDRVIGYAAPLADHPIMAAILRRRVETALRDFNLSPADTAVAVIGHSTRRNPNSRRATEAQAAQLRAAGLVAQVAAVYLDDTPAIPTIYTLTDAPCLIAVPYFLAAGSHTTLDVPGALGLSPGATQGSIAGRRVFYTDPMGVDDDLLPAVLDLAREAGATLHPAAPGEPWRAFPLAAAAALIEAVTRAGPLRFGDLRLSRDEVRVWGDASVGQPFSSPSALRLHIRTRPFRSLTTQRALPGGWFVPCQPHQVPAIVETIYPGLMADWGAAQSGRLVSTSLATTVARQTGAYRRLDALSPASQEKVTEQVCADCICAPCWAGAAQEDRLPCPEPCNHWLSAALTTEEHA